MMNITNEKSENLGEHPEQMLDMLVDGELSDTQRRDVLEWCQNDPQGWRSCALAFLEAQSWKRALGRVIGAKSPDRAHDLPATAASSPADGSADWPNGGEYASARGVKHFSHWGWPLAMAASFALAFTLGQAWQRRGGLPASQVPASQLASQRPSVSQADVSQPDTGLVPESMLASAKTGPPAAANSRDDPAWRNVRLVIDQGPNGQREIELPVVQDDGLNESWLWDQPPSTPPDVQQSLERMGHRVEQHRHLMPIDLDDGRRLVVPLDQIEVLPVSNRAYQ